MMVTDNNRKIAEMMIEMVTTKITKNLSCGWRDERCSVLDAASRQDVVADFIVRSVRATADRQISNRMVTGIADLAYLIEEPVQALLYAIDQVCALGHLIIKNQLIEINGHDDLARLIQDMKQEYPEMRPAVVEYDFKSHIQIGDIVLYIPNSVKRFVDSIQEVQED